MSLFRNNLYVFLITVTMSVAAAAQDTNPVDRRVSNPIDDSGIKTSTSGAVGAKQGKRVRGGAFEQEGGDGEVVVYSETQSVTGEDGKRVVLHAGSVDVRYGAYRLQADRVTIYEIDARVVAEGNVIFDQGLDQRITAERGEWNYKTKLGKFFKSTGYTNQTNDGSVVFFTAESVERISETEVLVSNGMFTACEDLVPKWSFSADEARISVDDRIRLKNAKFKVLDRALLSLPYVSLPIKKNDRASGFLTPSFGYSGKKGARLSGAYYKTLGDSADLTFRGDIFSARGIGLGVEGRTKANESSFLNFGFYFVKDRIFGVKADSANPDQGGSAFHAEGVQYFSNGFTAAVDVKLTSSLAFRQAFSEGIQQIISPIEVSQGFASKSWGAYTLNVLAKSQVVSIPNVRIKTRNLPSFHFERRPSDSPTLRNIYFGIRGSIEGVSRREVVDNLAAYRLRTGSDPIVSPAIGQRVDLFPEVTIPIPFRLFKISGTLGGRVTYYSNSFNDMRRVIEKDVTRKYVTAELDLRPVALARNFYGRDGAFRVRHTIEPYITYRRISGINNFDRIIRFDELDTRTDTNEIEFGLTNRFFTRKSAVSGTLSSVKSEKAGQADEKDSVQPYELLTVTVRGKYFIDPRFGGALVPGRRNQIAPLTSLSFYTAGGIPRRFSPLALEVNFKPRNFLFVDARTDWGVNGDGMRAASATLGLTQKYIKLFQTFFYTKAVKVAPAYAAFASAGGREAGTLRGSQWSPSVLLGNRERGPFGGASLFFDFQNRRSLNERPLISSLYTAGYAYDCCSLAVQYYTFNVGVRRENRYVFSFRLSGIGSVGTEQYGPGLR